MPPAADAGFSSAEALGARYGPAYRWLVTLGGLLGSMSMVLSATMINVAIPSVMGAFGIGQDLAQWAATAFLATMVISQLLNSWMVQAFGQRISFCFALVVFMAGGLIGASAPNIETLIAARVLQGFAAGLVQPLVLATVVAVFPPDRRGMAVGIYGSGVTLAPSFGPWIGGWREIFIVPLPLVAAALMMGLLFMPSKPFSWQLPKFDWTGFILVAGAILCVMSAIGNGARWGWSADQTVTLLFAGVVATLLFIASQQRTDNPLLDVSLFSDLRFISAMCIAFAFGAGNFATNYAIPVFMQTVQGTTPSDAGAVLVPAGILLVFLIPFAGRLADAMPSHYPIMVGCVAFSLATYLMSGADANTAYLSIALFAVLSRAALGLVMPNLGKVAMGTVAPDKLNQAAGTYNFFRQMGGAFGVNLTAVSLELQTARHADLLTATQTPDNLQSMEVLSRVGELLHRGGVPGVELHARALDYLGTMIYAQARTLGFQDAYAQISFAFALALIPAWILGRATKRNRRRMIASR